MSWILWMVCLLLGVALGVWLKRLGWLASLRRTPRYLQAYRAPDDAQPKEK